MAGGVNFRKEKKVSGRQQDSRAEVRCANCFACKKDTDLCPLNENYSSDAYLRWEAEYLKRRNEGKQ